MTVKNKIIMVLALPLSGLIAFVGFSFFQLRGVSSGMNVASGETFLPMIKRDIPEMNRLSQATDMLLNADRDAYQAFLAETVAARTSDAKELQQADRDNRENIDQVKQRMEAASAVFNQQMQAGYRNFQKEFLNWEKQSRRVILVSQEACEKRQQLAAKTKEGDRVFSEMRETLDVVYEALNKTTDLKQVGMNTSQLQKTHNAMELLLNADRDAYQAIFAQYKATSTTTATQLVKQDKDNAENIEQIDTRTAKAYALVSSIMPKEYKQFRSLLAKWRPISRQAVQLNIQELKLSHDRDVAAASAAASFKAMRNQIDELGNMLEARIKDSVNKMDQLGQRATGQLNVMAGGMSRSTVLFVIIGVVLTILSLTLGLVCISNIIRPLVRAVEVAKAVSQGDFSKRIDLKSNDEIGILAQAIDHVPITLEQINAQFLNLAKAADAGDLSFRGDANQFDGAYREIINIVNRTLDSISVPVNASLKVLDRMQVNDLTITVDTEGLKGDYLKIATSVNNVHHRLTRILETVEGVAVGDFSILPEYEKIGRRSEQDRLMPGFIKMMQAINLLIEDANMLAQAGQEGRLEARAEDSVHEGAYREIVIGVNNFIEAVAAPTGEVICVMNKVAKGDLTVRVAGDYHGKFAELKSNINISMSSLESTISQVAEAVQQVNSGSQQIADASQSLSQGATEQAASLEEITSSMNEIGSQITHNAESAGKASKLSTESRTAAETGVNNMSKMVEAMRDISVSSQQIAQVNKVIDDIAFQTNLLALNAAVEAARAGVHGKGFAVVADEVRNLAGRSAKAARETAEMIESSGNKVENGLAVAEETSMAFSSIVGGIVKVADLVGEIAVASNDQAQSIGQMNQGLGQIDQVTQQNTAHAEETAAAAEELSGQAGHLLALAGQFTVSGTNALLR